MKLKASLYDENALKRAIVRIAHEIVENNQSAKKLCIVKIKTRGIPFAQRLSKAIEKIEGTESFLFAPIMLEKIFPHQKAKW